MLAPGDRIPDVTLFDEQVRPVRLPELAAGGALLLAFYLYDWTRT
jgi:peroxiredoxin